MSGDYLWDRSGEPDPEVERLEELLGQFKHQPGEVPALDEPVPANRPAGWKLFLVAVVASTLLAVPVASIVAIWLGAEPSHLAYTVEDVAGTATVDGEDAAVDQRVRRGDVVETDADSQARLALAGLGEIDVLENSRVRIEHARPDEHELYLERGTIRASILAEPRVFQVGTPAGLAIDLGCLYTLSVEDDGDSVLRVELGQVSFEGGGREVFVPAGAEVTARKGEGPGTPMWEGVPAELRAANRRVRRRRLHRARARAHRRGRQRDALEPADPRRHRRAREDLGRGGGPLRGTRRRHARGDAGR